MIKTINLEIHGLLVILLLCTAQRVCASDVPGPAPEQQQAAELNQLRADMTDLKQAVVEVRRDQLNYQIERDLLKETYSSNVQTINIVIAIIFGAVTAIVSALAYLGIKGLRAVRDDFTGELAEFRASRTDIETRLANVLTRTDRASKRVRNLARRSETYDERLKYLEITEKIGTLCQQMHWAQALRYLDIALSIQPNDDIALQTKAVCELNMQNFDSAEQTYTLILTKEAPTIDQSIQTASENLAELLAFRKPLGEFDRRFPQFTNRLGRRIALLPDYLNAIQFVRQNDVAALKDLIARILPTFPQGARPLIDWQFREARYFCTQLGSGDALSLFVKLLDCLEGKLAVADLAAVVAPAPAVPAAG